MMTDYIGDDSPVVQPLANVDAEAALLGALLINNRLFDVAIELVTVEDFFEPLHGRIFGAVQDAISLGRVASPVTLRPMFVDDPAMRDLGGPSYLVELTANGAAIVGARDFANQVADLARLRRLHGEALTAVQSMTDTRDGVNPARHAAELERIAFEATATKSEKTEIFTMADSMRRTIAQIRSIQTSGAPIGAIAPDIPEIERVLGPLQRSHLTVLAGRPGMGKSALLCGMARSMAEAGYGFGLVSLEMGDIDLGQRFAADVLMKMGEDIPHAKIRDAKLTESELLALEAAIDHVDALPLKLVDAAGITLSRCAMIARRMKRELEAEGHTLDVFAVDYLQLLNADRVMENRTQEVTAISKGLKQLAKELGCAVIALSQLSRAVEQREVKIPQMSDLRESGSIEQDADNIGFLYRESYYLAQREPDKDARPREWSDWDLAMRACRDHMDLIVPKRRGGSVGKATMTFIREKQAVRGYDFYQSNAGAMFNG